MASLSAFNRWLEEDWGFAYQRPPDRGADALARRSRRARCAEVDSLIERGARMVHVRPAPVPGAERHRPVARRQARTTRCGPASPRRRSRSRSTSATAATTRFAAAWGGSATFGLRQQRRRSAASSCPTAPSTTRSPRSSSTACSPATRRCASPASRTAPTGWPLLVKRLRKQANQTPWVFAEDPLDTDPPARLGHAVLRGGPPRAGRPHRRRAHPVRLRLAPRRGPRRAARLRQGARRLRRGRGPQDHARQLPRAARGGRREHGRATASCANADLVAEVAPWLDEHWDPDLTVDEWWQHRRRGGLDRAALHAGAGRARPAAPRRRPSCGPRSPRTARCARPAASACSWPRRRS